MPEAGSQEAVAASSVERRAVYNQPSAFAPCHQAADQKPSWYAINSCPETHAPKNGSLSMG